MTSAPRHTASGPGPVASAWRPWLLRGLLLLTSTYVLCELLALLGFWWLDGQGYSPARLRMERTAAMRAAQVAETHEVGDPATAERLTPERLVALALNRRNVVVHPYLGFVLDPHKPHVFDNVIVNPGEEPRDPLVVNEFGFNDPDSPVQRRAPDRLIVGVLGGSVAMAFSYLGAPAVEARLRELPAVADRKIVWVRGALGGFKQPQQVMTLLYFLALGGEFDVVINLDGFNEVALYPSEDRQTGTFPAFPRGWRDLVAGVSDPQYTALVGAIELEKERRGQWAERMTRSVLRFSPLANLVWRAADRSLARRMEAERAALQRYRGTASDYAETGPPRTYASDAAMYADLAAIWMRGSLQLARLSAANGVSYLHFLQPNQYVPDAKPMDESERRVAHDAAGAAWKESVERGYPLLLERGEELHRQGVRFYDLTRIFAQVTQPVYMDHCCHLNMEGNAILGDRIGAAVVDALRAGDGPRAEDVPDAADTVRGQGPRDSQHALVPPSALLQR